jgi:hypothetical protein
MIIFENVKWLEIFIIFSQSLFHPTNIRVHPISSLLGGLIVIEGLMLFLYQIILINIISNEDAGILLLHFFFLAGSF